MKYETSDAQLSGPSTLTINVINRKMRSQLAALMGSVGFKALQSRALALATAEVSWLQLVHVTAEGGFEEKDVVAAKVGSEDFYEGSVIYLTQLLGLLETFIGENLTMQLMREVWPVLPSNDMNLGIGEK